MDENIFDKEKKSDIINLFKKHGLVYKRYAKHEMKIKDLKVRGKQIVKLYGGFDDKSMILCKQSNPTWFIGYINQY